MSEQLKKIDFKQLSDEIDNTMIKSEYSVIPINENEELLACINAINSINNGNVLFIKSIDVDGIVRKKLMNNRSEIIKKQGLYKIGTKSNSVQKQLISLGIKVSDFISIKRLKDKNWNNQSLHQYVVSIKRIGYFEDNWITSKVLRNLEYENFYPNNEEKIWITKPDDID